MCPSEVGDFVTFFGFLEGLDPIERRSMSTDMADRLGIAAEGGDPGVARRRHDSLFLARAVQAAQDGRHLRRVLLLVLVFGPLRVLVAVLLRPVPVLLLDSEALDVVAVHDLLDALVVVQDGEAGHLVEVRQVHVVPVATRDEIVPSRLQGGPPHGILDGVAHALLLGLLGPVGAQRVVEGGRAAEFARQDLLFNVDLLLDLRFTSQVVVVFVEGEGVILDGVLGLFRVHRLEVLPGNLADRLTVLIANNVSVSYLLVNCRVVDECASLLGCLLRQGLLLLLLAQVGAPIVRGGRASSNV